MTKLYTNISGLCRFCCFALLVIIIAPLSSNAQMGTPSVGGYSENPGNALRSGETLQDLLEGSFGAPMAADAFTTIQRSKTYRLTKLDNRLTGKAIAVEQVKESIIDELLDTIKTEAKAGRNVSKKIYGKSEGISYELLPAREDIMVILRSIISFEQTEENWGRGKLKLKAKTRFALEQVLPLITAIRGNQKVFSEISMVRSLATDAMNEIIQIQKGKASGSKTALNQRYLDATHRLIATDWFEKARYFSFSSKHQQAIDAYSKAIENSPGLAAAYRNRGALYAGYLKDSSKAVSDFVQAYSNDAIDHMESREFEACIEDTSAALKLYEDYARAYYQRAACRIGLGQQKNVKTDLVKAAQLGHKPAQDMLASKGMTW
ncbi:MAG: hypothetical protein V3S89_10325 [Desulfobacterales bacterium]